MRQIPKHVYHTGVYLETLSPMFSVTNMVSLVIVMRDMATVVVDVR